MKKLQFHHSFTALLLVLSAFMCQAKSISFSGSADNDLYRLLKSENYDVRLFPDASSAIKNAEKGSGVIISASAYPLISVELSDSILKAADAKGLRVYAEYVSHYPGVDIADTVFIGNIERGVVSSKFFSPELKPMSLFGLNGCHIYPAKIEKPLLSFARVAGFDTATFGLTDTDVYPLLWRKGNNIIAQSCMTNFVKTRQEPLEAWKNIWTSILRWICRDNSLNFNNWPSDPHPAFGRYAEITSADRKVAIRKGAEWIEKAKLLLHPSWRDTLYHYQGDGVAPWGPSVNDKFLTGNGSCGVLEGHGSTIDSDGKQNYRYWLRADVQGETAFLMASAAKSTGKKKYADISENILDYLFYSDDFIRGLKKDPGSYRYGLIGWAQTHDTAYYNDDNARCVLGAIGASALMKNQRWNNFIVNNIMANFNLTNSNGFLPPRYGDELLDKLGREHYVNSDIVVAHPHFSSWMWACYLWLYDKTGYTPLLDKTKKAIAITMDAYPDNWQWTNGIQQERARMILPLAWLIRVDDTPEHRQWLDTVVSKLLENQVESGAIREELGADGRGEFGKSKSNRDYGVREAPLIEKNGDPVADMLYTCNFAFFALNEAAHATGNQKYKDAAAGLGDFLVKIQATSESHPDIDGAWMRAFDYNRWDYWASNADAGWGAWSTLSGWIQSWIVGTLALVDADKSYWETTADMNVSPEMDNALKRLKLKD